MNLRLRIPWIVKIIAYSTYQHVCRQLSQLSRKKEGRLDVSFYCKYHQTTGSTVAIASIANNLAKIHNVDAYITHLSGYSRLLSLSVAQQFSPTRLNGTLLFTDIEQDNDVIRKLVGNCKIVILSCHAFPRSLHAVPQPQLTMNLELATYIHYVSDFQRHEFIRQYPDINIESKSFVIHNYTRKCTKHTSTRNAGIVGHLNRDVKNAFKAIRLAQESDCRLIQCWGGNTIAGLDNPGCYSKLRVNGWSSNIKKIHESFDVLISASQSETFGLVVSEAMSAGIPCLLSDIPVFRELFSDCDGVLFLSGNDQQDIRSINYLLDRASELKRPIIEYWQSHFSNETVSTAWFNKLAQISEMP